MADPTADDRVEYRLGHGPRRQLDLPPSRAVVWQLARAAARTREPADHLSRSPAVTVPTTSPITVTISQGTEPHIYRADALIALAPAGDGTGNCTLVASRLTALTYFNGPPPS